MLSYQALNLVNQICFSASLALKACGKKVIPLDGSIDVTGRGIKVRKSLENKGFPRVGVAHG